MSARSRTGSTTGRGGCSDSWSSTGTARPGASPVLDGELGLGAVDEDDPAVLLLDRILMNRRGHPGVLSAVAYELARRAGAPSGVYSSPTRWYVGLRTEDALVLLDADRGFDWPDAPVRVRAHCAHEVAFCFSPGSRGATRGTGRRQRRATPGG
jgi:Transglutaminase-like superfamily